MTKKKGVVQLKPDRSTPENKEYWDFVERTKKEMEMLGVPGDIDPNDDGVVLGEPDSLEGTFVDELRQLKEFRNFIFENCYGIEVNANDLFSYATSESIRVPADDLDIYWMAHRKFGYEGEVAFMRLCAVRYNGYTELPEPLEDYFTRGMMDKEKYEAAKDWLAEIQCECRDSDDKELRIDHIEYGKHCQFGWKIERPMYDDKNVDKEGNVETYW